MVEGHGDPTWGENGVRTRSRCDEPPRPKEGGSGKTLMKASVPVSKDRRAQLRRGAWKQKRPSNREDSHNWGTHTGRDGLGKDHPKPAHRDSRHSGRVAVPHARVLGDEERLHPGLGAPTP